jgi:thioredoxin 1
MALVKVHSNEEFKKEVLEADVPVIVDFYADWCGPCRMIAPVFEKLSSDYEGKMKFVKLNVEEVGEAAVKYGVMSIPTLIIFKNGEPVSQQLGALPEPMLKGWIDQNL